MTFRKAKATAIFALGAAAFGTVAMASPAAADPGSGSLISVLDGASVQLLPWQFCGSDLVAGIGLSDSSYSPNVVDGGCENASVAIGDHYGHHHSCDDACTLVYPQDCPVCQQLAGQTEAAPVAAPSVYHGEHGQHHGQHGFYGLGSLVSVGNGSSITALPWQFCGSSAVLGIGLSQDWNSGNMVHGGCRNATTVIR